MEPMTFSPHIFNEYKTRNILSLSERIEVIREYDRQLTRPSLQSLASKFECSSKQIKNILLNRESILQQYNGGTPLKEDSERDDVLQKRQEKIEFLGKVMYEYIQRVLYFNYTIDDEKVRQKALQIKECIAVENFQPTNGWLSNFKLTYGIPAFDLESLRNNVVITEAKRPHLSAIDMIQYVSRIEQEELEQMGGRSNNSSFSKSDINGNASRTSTNGRNNASMQEPKIIYEVPDDEDQQDEELQKLNFNSSQNHQQNISMSKASKRRASSPFPDVESVEEALKHIKVLEDYAMLSDNFRAIGLLTQLEQAFKKLPKKK